MGNTGTADANSPARDVRIWGKLVKWGHWGNQVGQRREAEIRRYIAGGKHTGINQLGSQFSNGQFAADVSADRSC